MQAGGSDVRTTLVSVFLAPKTNWPGSRYEPGETVIMGMLKMQQHSNAGCPRLKHYKNVTMEIPCRIDVTATAGKGAGGRDWG
jgi:hypothetical protein